MRQCRGLQNCLREGRADRTILEHLGVGSLKTNDGGLLYLELPVSEISHFEARTTAWWNRRRGGVFRPL